MDIGQVIRFHDERFFDGAVQLGWIQRRVDFAQQAAAAFVFHGPRYHGAGETEPEGIEGTYRLKDTAGFVRDLLGSMHAGAEGRDANPYWLVVAGYGSGKSHLALTCATLLSEPNGVTTRLILEQINRADAEIGETVVEQVAAMEKPALVLPLDGMAGFHLGNALSRAVFAQLRQYGVDAGAIRDLSPRFQSAEQFVERNFAVRANDFAERMPGLDAEQISARLRENDEEIYTKVDALYNDANGHPIPLEGQESAQELIETLCSVYCGPEGPFSHVVILFDELGRYLEYAAEKPQLAGDAALQQIFQGVQDNNTKVRFVGFIQYELKAYLKRFGGADLRQLQRYVTRFDTADKWYLSTNLETIFAHMIGKEEAALERLWRQTDAERQNQLTRQRMSQALPGFGRFPVWSDPGRFAQVIARGCWPLHPFAVWFLTRQRDLVQSRSALTFIKDVIERIAGEDVQIHGRLRQVSAADLIVGSMLPELISAERETGGTIAETLQTLLQKLSGHIDSRQQRVLAGVAVLEKTRVGKQSRETAVALLGEATALEIESLPALLDSLSRLGAVEWNGDLGQYEILSDGATRGQFQKWLHTQQAGFKADGIRDLFVRRGAADTEELGDRRPDFAHSRDIATPDWFFEARSAHTNSVENAIQSTFQEWRQATLPKDAKGKLIYLYLHPDDDLVSVGERVRACLDAELTQVGQPRAPIWIIGIADRHGAIAEHIARLYLFDEQMSDGDRERFRRFIPDERERSRTALKDAVQQAIKEQLYWVAGFPEALSGRLRPVGLNIFSRVYPQTTPFPFDGFGSAAGGGATDAAQLARILIARQFSVAWAQTQPRKLQNRIDAVLIQSWKALLPSGRLVAPTAPDVGALYQWLEQVHQDNPKRSLETSYRALIAPPYGMNASSASLLLGLLLGLDSPPRRIEQAGELVASADWVGRAFPSQRGKHRLDETVLAQTRLRFLSGGGEERWRSLLGSWDAEENYQRKVHLANEAIRMLKDDPLPEVLEGDYKYLRDKSDQAAAKLLEMANGIKEWERGIEKAARKTSIHHAIRLGSQISHQRNAMQDSPHWPPGLVRECNTLIELAQGLIAPKAANWIPRQSCRTVAQVAEFRQRTEKDAEGLAVLGFTREAEALTQQARQSIYRVEQLQQFSLTLDQCSDYPRQPVPTDSTPVRALRDNITLGDRLIEGVQAATALSGAEIDAHVDAIRQRQQRLRAALKHQRDNLGMLYGLQIESEEVLHEALTKANRLRQIFVGTADESEVNELVIQLERILSDAGAWEAGDVSVERLDELLRQQIEHQLQAFQMLLDEQEIDQAWDLESIYRVLVAKRVRSARRRSSEWVRPRLVLADRIGQLDRTRCTALERELSAAPAYLSEQDRAQVERLLDLVERRGIEFDEQERRAKVDAWRRRFLDLAEVDSLDRHQTEQLMQSLQHPPCVLRLEEQAQLTPITERLTAHLDQMNVDELVARIERLPQPQQRLLFARLTALLGG